MTALRVLTFNIWQLPVVSLVGARRRRARLAGELIERVAPDVVVLNEAFGLSPAGRLVAGLRAAGYHATDQVGRGGGTWSSTSGRRGGVSRLVGGGIYVLSRHPITQRHQHVYRTHRRGTSDAWSAKGVALVAILLGERRVWLAATHLQADERGDWHAVRLAQLAELRALVDTTVPAGEPVLIAGDLNVQFHGRDTDHADANRVLGGRIEPDGPIHEFTFDGAGNPLVRGADRRYRNVLDYVGQLNAERPSWTIRTETLRYESGREISDHFPVLSVANAQRRAITGVGARPRYWLSSSAPRRQR